MLSERYKYPLKEINKVNRKFYLEKMLLNLENFKTP